VKSNVKEKMKKVQRLRGSRLKGSRFRVHGSEVQGSVQPPAKKRPV
jgi:hypothetical protein